MNADTLIKHLLEAEDEAEDFDVKELVEPGEETVAGPTTVKRHGRFKIVDMPRYTFLISYLTPVAYCDKVFRTYYRTLKKWSPTTNQHIEDWRHMIAKTPEWENNPENWEKSTYNPTGHYVRSPSFKSVRQARISKLFRELIHTMEMKSHLKRRMYHVDPRMRQGSAPKRWISGHLKHHDTGEEGLPRPDDPDYGTFFKDFDPDEPESYDWQTSGYRNQEPYERGDPDEE